MMAKIPAEIRTYLLVFLALLVLLAATVGVAFLDLGPFSPILALTIAIGKALLIMMYFMHLRHSAKLTWVFAAVGFMWLVIMLGLTMADFLTRG
jgi:cytochrome c oxidase subunit 4